MCSYKTWFHDDKVGYITECLDCQNIQLGFGNIMITFQKGDFQVFRNYVERNMEQLGFPGERQVKSIVLKTPCMGINFLLSGSELQGLHTMIDYADTEMKAGSLLQLFSR